MDAVDFGGKQLRDLRIDHGGDQQSGAWRMYVQYLLGPVFVPVFSWSIVMLLEEVLTLYHSAKRSTHRSYRRGYPIGRRVHGDISV